MRTSTTIALLTYKNFHLDNINTHYNNNLPQHLTQDDAMLMHYLKQSGARCNHLAWDDPYEIEKYDILIIRSTWNYYHSADLTNKFIEFVSLYQERLLNSANTIIWNYNKKYLLELQTHNINIIPTILLPNITRVDLHHIRPLFEHSDAIIIKPTISGASRNIYKVRIDSIHHDLVSIQNKLAEQGVQEVIIQPFLKSIIEYGEVSLVFFNNQFSHAVKKIYTNENFLKHSIVIPYDISADNTLALIAQHILEIAHNILKSQHETFLFARLDFFWNPEQGFLLSELELIEPDLFIQGRHNLTESFSKAILSKLK